MSVQIYTDGSSIDEGVGSVAVLYIYNTPQQMLKFYLGSEDHHTVYEAKLVGLTLAAGLLQQPDFLEDVSITFNNQVAIKWQLTTAVLQDNNSSELIKWHQGLLIKIHCIHGHKGILGNEEADKVAKQVAKQQGDPPLILPSILHSPLPHHKSTSKTNFAKQLKEDAYILF